MKTYECDKGCGFYKNAHLSDGDACRLLGCGGTVREVQWVRSEPLRALVATLRKELSMSSVTDYEAGYAFGHDSGQESAADSIEEILEKED